MQTRLIQYKEVEMTGVLHNCTDSEIKQTLNTFISDINI